jgi:GrpB-like predicted nucleotidyltransferase (UPF0157 family)
VQNLPAKDIIDIQVSVDDLNTCGVVTRLGASGYNIRAEIQSDSLVGLDGESLELRKALVRNAPGRRPATIHVREVGKLNQRYPLVFRDFLRADVSVRQAYAEIKQELARRFADDADTYYAIKDPYMDTVYRAAMIWGEATGWEPDENFR